MRGRRRRGKTTIVKRPRPLPTNRSSDSHRSGSTRHRHSSNSRRGRRRYRFPTTGPVSTDTWKSAVAFVDEPTASVRGRTADHPLPRRDHRRLTDPSGYVWPP